MMSRTTPEARGSVLFLVGVSVSEFNFISVFQSSVFRYSKGEVCDGASNCCVGLAQVVTSPLTLTGRRPPGVAATAGRQEKDSRGSSRECRAAVVSVVPPE